jgi:hypothetical protein
MAPIGKGSASHKASIVVATVGDPFKDTSGYLMDILNNIVAIVSLVIAPLLTERRKRQPAFVLFITNAVQLKRSRLVHT